MTEFNAEQYKESLDTLLDIEKRRLTSHQEELNEGVEKNKYEHLWTNSSVIDLAVNRISYLISLQRALDDYMSNPTGNLSRLFIDVTHRNPITNNKVDDDFHNKVMNVTFDNLNRI